MTASISASVTSSDLKEPNDNLSLCKGSRFAAGLCLFLAFVFSAAADEYYLQPGAFLEQAFDGAPPEASLVWLTGERADTVTAILDHRPASLRVRYWKKDERTVWILEEIGREELITAGFVVDNGRLADVRVLAFRESRGWEIKHDFFTRQFDGLALAEDHRLDGPIDNITGATLSVNAMRRMARLALYLDAEVRNVAP